MDNKVCKRAKNFSKVEIQTLVENISIQRHVLFGPIKGTPVQRNRAWENICEAVNDVSELSQLRRVEDIKKKFKDLKNRTKMKVSLIEQEMVGSDESTSRKLSRIDKLIMSFIDDSNRADKEESDILVSEIKVENLQEEEEEDPLEPLVPEKILISVEPFLPESEEKHEDISAASPESLIYEENPKSCKNNNESDQVLQEVRQINENLEKLAEIQEKRLEIEKRKLEIMEEQLILKKSKYSNLN